MKKENHHIIEKQLLEVEMENAPDAFGFRNQLGTVYYEKILPQLEALFNEAGGDNKLIRIENLQIDIGTIKHANWEDELATKAVAKIREAILYSSPIITSLEGENNSSEISRAGIEINKNAKVPTSTESFNTVFYYFLQHGRLPWYAVSNLSLQQGLNDLLQNTSGFKSSFTSFIITAEPHELTRLAYQFDTQSLNKIIKILLPQPLTALSTELLTGKDIVVQYLQSLPGSKSVSPKLKYLPIFKWIGIVNKSEEVQFYNELLAKLPVVSSRTTFNIKTAFRLFYITKLIQVLSLSTQAGFAQIQNVLLSLIISEKQFANQQELLEAITKLQANIEISDFSKEERNNKSGNKQQSNQDKKINNSGENNDDEAIKSAIENKHSNNFKDQQDKQENAPNKNETGKKQNNLNNPQEDNEGKSLENIDDLSQHFQGLVTNQHKEESVNDFQNQPENKQKNKLENKAKNKHNSKTEAIQETYIQNAGLVILHPFLLPFFRGVELLTENNEFINEEASMRAVLLTQYLTTGLSNFGEHELVLNKIFCGYPIEKPLVTEMQLTELEIEEAANLLTHVTQLWKKNDIVINSTIEGLQTSFLQRDGKLTQKEKDWKLQVEQKPYDMLLASLPWGIGIIKNTFMQGKLWVEWA